MPTKTPSFPRKPIAGNGILDRRLFLLGTLKFSLVTPLLGLTKESTRLTDKNESVMNHLAQPFSKYGEPSSYEDQVTRWISTNPAVNGNGASWTPLHRLEGIITPNGLHFVRHHNGIPLIDPKQHQLIIHGLVKRPLVFSLESLLRYPMQSRISFIECGGNSRTGYYRQPARGYAGYLHGLVSCAEWTGVPLRLLLKEALYTKSAKWIIPEGADAYRHQISLPLSKALDDVLLVLYQNGERLRPENGYPLRLLVPGWEGVVNVKWLHSIKLVDRAAYTRDETVRYSELRPSGKTIIFNRIIKVKSLITQPSTGTRLNGPGVYLITGISWTGNGKITRVEVSADGGKSWGDAELQLPILERAFTRFRIPWRWNGKSCVLMSRAIDSAGYRQPMRRDFIAQYGSNAEFHYHAVIAWHVNNDGFIVHAYDENDGDNQFDFPDDGDI